MEKTSLWAGKPQPTHQPCLTHFQTSSDLSSPTFCRLMVREYWSQWINVEIQRLHLNFKVRDKFIYIYIYVYNFVYINLFIPEFHCCLSCVEVLIHAYSEYAGDLHVDGVLRDQKIPQISFTAGLGTKLLLKKGKLKLLKSCWRTSDRKLEFQSRGFGSSGWFLVFIRPWSYSLALHIPPLFIKLGKHGIFLPQYLLPKCLFIYMCNKKKADYYFYQLSFFSLCVHKAPITCHVQLGYL